MEMESLDASAAHARTAAQLAQKLRAAADSGDKARAGALIRDLVALLSELPNGHAHAAAYSHGAPHAIMKALDLDLVSKTSHDTVYVIGCIHALFHVWGTDGLPPYSSSQLRVTHEAMVGKLLEALRRVWGLPCLGPCDLTVAQAAMRALCAHLASEHRAVQLAEVSTWITWFMDRHLRDETVQANRPEPSFLS